jgi:hypothetical protein
MKSVYCAVRTGSLNKGLHIRRRQIRQRLISNVIFHDIKSPRRKIGSDVTVVTVQYPQ